MKFLGCTCLLLGLAALIPARAQAPAVEGPLADALVVLRSGYVDFSRLQPRPGDSLDALAARSGGEVSFLTSPAAKDNSVPAALPALLPDNIVYCRLASFRTPSSWPDLAARFERWVEQGAQGVVLDVRSNEAPGDFDGAAQWAGLFTPPGTVLFSVRDARGNPRSYASIALPAAAPLPATMPLVILTDDRTTGAAEAFAAALQARGALVMGQATAGRAGLFAEQPLASGGVIRYLAGEVVLPDGTVLWNHPVVPDVGVSFDEKKEQAALALIGQEHIADVIGEATPRERMNEAALVRGEDPEITLSTAEANAAPAPLAVQDVVLVDALDSLKAIRLSQRAEASSTGARTAPENVSAAR